MKLEEALGYTYQDKTLLQMALSHSSYANEMFKDNLHSYERLEFLGDSILGFVTADYLYRTFPTKHEGELTRIRAELVCEKNLSEIAERLHMSVATVKTHILNMLEKTGFRNRTELAVRARESGLVILEEE